MEQNCLVVASQVAVRKQLGEELRRRGYNATLCSSGAEALKFCSSISLDTALVEDRLPDMTGESLREKILRERPSARVIILTNFDRVRRTTDQLRFDQRHYLISVDEVADLVGGPARERPDGAPGFEQLGNEALLDTLDVVVGLLEVDDRHFGGTSHQAARLAFSIAQTLGCPRQVLQEIALATLLRDIGRVGLPESLGTAEGPLTPDQQSKMRGHVETSIRLLEHIQFPWKILPVIRHHHERYDGQGYPDGLRGREIPLGARIVAVVDAWVAMISPRSHRDARDPDEAMSELMCEAGHQFDPEIVEALQSVIYERTRAGDRRGKPHVLVIDPDPEFRKLLKLKLVNEGFVVGEIDDVAAAPKTINGESFDAVLVDIDSDAEAALKLLHDARTQKGAAPPPFLALSSREDRVLQLRALREGVDELLSKNSDLEELAARVNNVLIRETLRAQGVREQRRRGIVGNLENLSIADIVQTLVVGMKTACVTIQTSKTGKVWFEQGALIRAECGKKRGENAFYEMVTWAEGEFLIEHGIKAEPNLEGDAIFLLMEGLRRLDEKVAAKAAS